VGSPAGVRLLLDTHAWLWRLLEPERLSRRAEKAIAANRRELFLSPVSTWETLVLARKGRLVLEPSAVAWVSTWLRRSGVAAVPLTHEIALRSEQLGRFASEDPADRFLVATALEYGLTLVTSDRAMRSFAELPTLW
jgi:PIN domain nuclease of toxin-antitoxin system